MPVKNYVPCKIAQNTKRNLVPWKAEAASSRSLPRATPAIIAKGNTLIPWQPVSRPNRYIPVMPAPCAPAPVPGGQSKATIPPMPPFVPHLSHKYNDHPSDYAGFREGKRTYIEIEHAPTTRPISLRFDFEGWDPDRKTHFQLNVPSGSGGSGNPTIIQIYPPLSTSPFPVYPPPLSIGDPVAVFGMDSPGGKVDTDRFDHITMSSNYLISAQLVVFRIKIVLNDYEILNQIYQWPGLTVNSKTPLIMDDLIWRHRLVQIKYHEIDWTGVSEINRNIILYAAMDAGQSWSPWYGVWDFDEVINKWDDSPRLWCSEYTNWTIARATGGRVCPYETGISIDSQSMYRFFRDRDLFYGPANNLPYEERLCIKSTAKISEPW